MEKVMVMPVIVGSGENVGNPSVRILEVRATEHVGESVIED